ncbi:carotenoid oxygenase [Cantharellus anzutake]|uniref:carotenoid oxygenase n=1 Tax=Cantharellus anzutake TaxID=1750568 RepID=UPI00190484CB|nr:carotenoid oxygenase [Cantharellus anzutake]KAF8328689.1 carotenoid oxygenase [Cantharellus anzutake]
MLGTPVGSFSCISQSSRPLEMDRGQGPLNGTDPGPGGHPYLIGGFAPIHKEHPCTPCEVVGEIPIELCGGQYIRNGPNPLLNDDLGRDAHWFDGDGMLCAVYFSPSQGNITTQRSTPYFTNRFIYTDVLSVTLDYASLPRLFSTMRHPLELVRPLVISVATFSDPKLSLWNILKILLGMVRIIFYVLLSWCSPSRQRRHDNDVHPGRKRIGLKQISTANTNIVWHDGYALALSETGPPMWVSLPGLETIDWIDFALPPSQSRNVQSPSRKEVQHRAWSFLQPLRTYFREWLAAHPKFDPLTGEAMAIHNSFGNGQPYIKYTVLPPSNSREIPLKALEREQLQKCEAVIRDPVCPPWGNSSSQPKFAHDIACSQTHTVVIDLPLTLNPFAMFRGRPMMEYLAHENMRFTIFKRHPSASDIKPGHANGHPYHGGDGLAHAHTREAKSERPECGPYWFEESEKGRLMLHTASCWDEYDNGHDGSPNEGERRVQAVHLIGLRMPDAYFIYEAGTVLDRVSDSKVISGGELCYYRFELPLTNTTFGPYHWQGTTGHISHSFALSNVQFDFPRINPLYDCGRRPSSSNIDPSKPWMGGARYVYGCGFLPDAAQGSDGYERKSNANYIVKMDLHRLVEDGLKRELKDGDLVDQRGLEEVIADGSLEEDGVTPGAGGVKDAVKVFRMPKGWRCGEPTFVPRTKSSGDEVEEDEGWLLTFVFDEGKYWEKGSVMPCADARSELWIIDAEGMKDIVARIILPTRVPYGFHGDFFTAEQIATQREIPEGMKPRGWVNLL